jgi:tetratricopeptide (TPR) repeat protein
MPGMRNVALAALLLAALPLAAQDPMAIGDAAWARRAEGRQGDRAAAGPINEAVAAYERAVKEQPDRLEGYSKLLRALHYKGDYAVHTKEGKQQVFGRGREVVEAALDRIGRRAGRKLDDLPPAQVAKLVSKIPEAPEIFLWGGIHWGLWGDVYGRIAAARQGVGDKIRRYGEITVALDERLEKAGGHRLLGRLHTLAPKIPLVTGWVDRGKAVSHLRRAVALAPEDLYNQVYLADALLQHQPEKAAEAREILRKVIQKKPDPARVVEDERALADARQLLGS